MARELARYRGLPASTQYEALSSRHPRQCSPQHSCQRQRNARLAHLLRLRPTPDWDRSTALCRGTARHRVEGHGLRTRLDHNRSVPFGILLGTRATGLVCDQTVILTGFYSRKGFEAPLRRIKFNDPETGKRLVFLTNNFALPALTIAQLYRLRWRVELFFKWIKQHLPIKAFFGTT